LDGWDGRDHLHSGGHGGNSVGNLSGPGGLLCPATWVTSTVENNSVDNTTSMATVQLTRVLLASRAAVASPHMTLKSTQAQRTVMGTDVHVRVSLCVPWFVVPQMVSVLAAADCGSDRDISEFT